MLCTTPADPIAWESQDKNCCDPLYMHIPFDIDEFMYNLFAVADLPVLVL